MKKSMTVRITVVAALVMAAVSSPLSAQGVTKQQVVVSPAVIKSITAQKPRSKTPMTARVGMKRAPTPANAATRKTKPAAPTSVRSLPDPKTAGK
jgi:hypothetical protein